VIPRFALARPGTLGEAFAAFEAAGGDAAWYAGGTELLQVMKMGLARFGTLIDLKRLPELRGIAVDEGARLVIGGGTTHREIERSADVRRELPALAELASVVANTRVRNQGTLAGNLCFAEPHSDPATLLVACDAAVRLRSADGERVVPVGTFVEGPFATARRPEEILVSVEIPARGAGEGRAYEKAKFRERPAVTLAVRLRLAGDRIAEAHVAVGAMTDAPQRVESVGTALVGRAADGEELVRGLAAGSDALGHVDAASDLDGSADYKRHLAGVLLGRATRAALAEATGGA
jgi:carbon-monoxide dehydrogenase medium subunit